MTYQIDQSGKIEQTNLDTVIALSNDIQTAIILPRKTKRIIKKIFREQGKSKIFIYLTFSALIFLLLKLFPPKKKVIIDKEYPGYEEFIKLNIINNFQKMKIPQLPVLGFGLVGKSSRAHDYANKIAKKIKKANKIVKLEEILKLILIKKRSRAT